MNFRFALSVLVAVAVAAVAGCAMSASELDAARRATIVSIENSPNLNCGDFRTSLETDVEQDATWFNPGVGAFVGRDGIDEYYQLVLPPGGGCGNAIGFQVAKLETTPFPASIVQTGDNEYQGNWRVDASFVPLPPFDGNTWGVTSRGHYFRGLYNFTECSAKVNYYVTYDLDREVLYVGNVLAAAPPTDPVQWCGVMAAAQTKYQAIQGYNPVNITGFDFTVPNGFADCVAYHAYLLAKGDLCGTPQVDHTVQCFFRHMLTYLGNDAGPAHVHHWAKQDANHTNTKCIDRCAGLLATCHADADPIPGNTINLTENELDYYCQCPVGWEGDGVTSCDRVNCTGESDCKPNQYTTCDANDGICQPMSSFFWDRTHGEGDCPVGYKPTNNATDHRFYCIRNDKCWDHHDCLQPPDRVNCEYLGNLASPFGACQCHAGYQGGFDVDCTCSANRTETNAGPGFKVCLGSGECTIDDHCNAGETCSSSYYNEIGACQ